MPKARPAVFLDRDGTLIEDVGYPRKPAEVRLLPGVGETLRELQRQAYLLIVVFAVASTRAKIYEHGTATATAGH